ncbi:MAG: hypothetical protein AAF985_03510 [Bacteroidota bacterium]
MSESEDNVKAYFESIRGMTVANNKRFAVAKSLGVPSVFKNKLKVKKAYSETIPIPTAIKPLPPTSS